MLMAIVPENNNFLAPEAIDEDPHNGGKYAQFHSTQRCGNGNLGVAPAEFLCDGLNESSKSCDHCPADVKGNGKTCRYNKPTVIDPTHKPILLKEILR